MRRLESVVSWGLLIAVIGGVAYFFPTQLRTVAHEIYAKVAPCSMPTTYRIVSIDPRFGISSSTLKSDLVVASGLWNKAHGTTLFSYDPNGTVGVSLVYDSRQEMTQRLRQMGITISDDRSSYNAVKARYDSTFAVYATQKKKFDADVAAFDAAKAAYDKDVAYWNARGGAPRAQFEALQAQQHALAAQSASLQIEQDSLNAAARDVNDLAVTLNQLIKSLNLDVQTYNSTGDSNGTSFEEGVYEKSLGLESITIFEYENNALLTRVLAHELGHAIGLDHVKDPNAIMYYLNQGTAIALTHADTDELAAVCKKPF